MHHFAERLQICAALHELVLSIGKYLRRCRAGALDLHQLETRQNDDLDCGTYQTRLRLPRSSTIAIAISLRVRETKAVDAERGVEGVLQKRSIIQLRAQTPGQ